MSIVVSDKFKKELYSFFEWCNNRYTISNIDDEEFNWSLDLNIKFEEPSRNKLEIYIQSILKKFIIVNKSNESIGDAKLLSKEFKNAQKEPKEKKVKELKEKKVKEVKEPKEKKVKKVKEPKETKEEKVKEVKEPKEKKVKEPKEPKERKEEKVESNIKIDMLLDTSDVDNLDVLEYWTEDLINVFGKPKKTGGNDDDIHIYEWKISINNEIYSIYDISEDIKEDFENITWYLGGTSSKYIKDLYKHIDTKLNCKLQTNLNDNEDSIIITLSDIESDSEI